MDLTLALIGFGEAGSTFAGAANWRDKACAFDIDESRAAAMETHGIRCAKDAASALASAQVVLSLVTADEALKAAQDYARHLQPGTLWIDMNSVAPATKQSASAVIEGNGGAYVDAALLAPVQPAALGVPILLSGTQAQRAETALSSLGFVNVKSVGTEIGRASSIKMIRSVMVKGIEALTAEMVAAAEAAGVSEEVFTSLDASERRQGWEERAAYNLERMETHGERRAAEMEEVAKTLLALGVEPEMTRSTVTRQRLAAATKPTARKDAA